MDIPGPLGDSAVEIAESIPSLSSLNGVDTTKILESGKGVIDSVLLPRLPEWNAGEPLIDRVLNAMWLCLMSYRLADEEKIDETSIWYVFQFNVIKPLNRYKLIIIFYLSQSSVMH